MFIYWDGLIFQFWHYYCQFFNLLAFNTDSVLMNSFQSACYKDVALVRSSPTMMGDDIIIIICSLVRHLPWPWVGAPHPTPPRLQPALFLLTIPTLLTLQESLMKHRLFLGPLRLPAELLKGITHKQICMFINILYTPIPQHSPHPHTHSGFFLYVALAIMSTEWDTGICNTEVCASVTGSHECWIPAPLRKCDTFHIETHSSSAGSLSYEPVCVSASLKRCKGDDPVFSDCCTASSANGFTTALRDIGRTLCLNYNSLWYCFTTFCFQEGHSFKLVFLFFVVAF